MKLMIASDIHGSALYCGQLLDAFAREETERLLLLGDLLYHGPRNDLPDGYDPKRVIEQLNAVSDRLLCVRGNCDAEVDQMVLRFPVMAEYCILYAAGRMIFATHGHHFNTQTPPPLRAGDVLLHGHTHIPACEDHDGWVYLNPGSVSIPKDGSQRGYMLLDGNRFVWKSLIGETLREYEL